MKIRVVEQTDPNPDETNPDWCRVDDFLPEDAAEIRAGKLVRYTVQIVRGDTEDVTVLAESCNHIGQPGMAGTYGYHWKIPYSAPEMIKAARDLLTGAAGLEVGDHVIFPGQRPHGAGRLFQVLEVPMDDEGYGLGNVRIRQVDAVAGVGDLTVLASVVSKDIPPRVPIEGRNRGGIGETFVPRAGGGFLVYRGDYADQVVMPPSALDRALWGCRSIDEFGDDVWAHGFDREDAVRAHGRKYPNKGLYC